MTEKNQTENTDSQQQHQSTGLDEKKNEAPSSKPNEVLQGIMIVGILCFGLLFAGYAIFLGEIVVKLFFAVLPILIILGIVAGVVAYIVLSLQSNSFRPWDKW